MFSLQLQKSIAKPETLTTENVNSILCSEIYERTADYIHKNNIY